MFRGLTLIPPNTRLPFMRTRMFAFVVSAVMIVGSFVLIAVKGLDYGIDFKGGILMEARFDKPADIAGLRGKLGALNLGEVALQEFGGPTEVLIRVERQEGDQKAQERAIEKVKNAIGPGAEYRRVEFVGPQVGQELFREALIAVVLALGGIVVYIWFRFEWKFGVCAVFALLHDVVSTVGLFSLASLEFNLSTVAAILTIAGYSINDTVVVFDRVRENLRKYKTMPLIELFDLSINETLSRTIITGGSTFLVIIAMLLFGGPVIRDFNLALLFGIAVGTYSSVCVAVPLLLYMKLDRRSVLGVDKKEEGGAAASQSP